MSAYRHLHQDILRRVSARLCLVPLRYAVVFLHEAAICKETYKVEEIRLAFGAATESHGEKGATCSNGWTLEAETICAEMHGQAKVVIGAGSHVG